MGRDGKLGITLLLAQPARPSAEMEAKKAARRGGWSLGFSLVVVKTLNISQLQNDNSLYGIFVGGVDGKII